MTLGERLKVALARAGLSAEAMGRELDLTGAAVRQWTNDRSMPPVAALSRFAHVTGASLLWLLEGDAAPAALSDWAVAFADLVAAGADPAAAVSQVTGGAAALSDAEAALLSEAAAAGSPSPGAKGAAAAEIAGLRRALDAVTRLLVEAEDREERGSLLRVQAEKLARLRVLKQEAARAPEAPSAGALALSPEALAGIAAAFEPVWEESGGEERRALANVCLAQVPVWVEARPAPAAYERRVLPIVYAPWLARLLSPVRVPAERADLPDRSGPGENTGE